jgi:hypothetical protein
VGSCLLRDYKISAEEANSFLRNGIPVESTFMDDGVPSDQIDECRKALRAIADGSLLAQMRREHWMELVEASPWVLGVLAVLYGLGWVAGWVWRGFFPKKAPAA